MRYVCINYIWGEIYESDNEYAILNKIKDTISDLQKPVKKIKVNDYTWEIREK